MPVTLHTNGRPVEWSPLRAGVTKPIDAPLSRDRLAMVSRRAAADGARLSLFQLQDQRPEAALMGAAVLFATLCSRCRLDPQDVHRMAMRMLMDASPYHKDENDALSSLRSFAGIRMMGQEDTVL